MNLLNNEEIEKLLKMLSPGVNEELVEMIKKYYYLEASK